MQGEITLISRRCFVGWVSQNWQNWEKPKRSRKKKQKNWGWLQPGSAPLLPPSCHPAAWAVGPAYIALSPNYAPCTPPWENREQGDSIRETQAQRQLPFGFFICPHGCNSGLSTHTSFSSHICSLTALVMLDHSHLCLFAKSLSSRLPFARTLHIFPFLQLLLTVCCLQEALTDYPLSLLHVLPSCT